MFKKNIIKDFSLNIIGTAISTVSAQLIIYPLISKSYGSLKFGEMLTVIAVVNIVAVVIGGSLNNIRLVERADTDNSGANYNLLFSIFTVLGAAIGLVFIKMLDPKILFSEMVILFFLICLTSFRSYAGVFFRIDLNYTKVLIHTCITSCGYLLGLTLFRGEFFWGFIFLTGEVCSLIYLVLATKIVSEKFTTNNSFKKIFADFLQLFSSNIVSNCLLYFDRIFLQVLLGGIEVSIFYAASLIGKLVGTALQPISSVILSYLAKSEKSNPWDEFIKLLKLVLFFSIIFLVITYPFVPKILGLIYPDLAEKATQYAFWANLSSILLISGNLIQPILLRFVKLYWQNVVQITYACIYLSLSAIFSHIWGLNGFILASIISNAYRFLFYIVISIINLRPEEEKND